MVPQSNKQDGTDTISIYSFSDFLFGTRDGNNCCEETRRGLPVRTASHPRDRDRFLLRLSARWECRKKLRASSNTRARDRKQGLREDKTIADR